MPPIHVGDSTHHHDQVMTPVSLSAISVITAIWKAEAGTESLRHRTLGRCRSIRMSGTLPAYGAGGEQCYRGMSAGLPGGSGGAEHPLTVAHPTEADPDVAGMTALPTPSSR